MDARELQTEFYAALVRGADLLTATLKAEGRPLTTEALQAFCVERANNLAQSFATRTHEEECDCQSCDPSQYEDYKGPPDPEPAITNDRFEREQQAREQRRAG